MHQTEQTALFTASERQTMEWLALVASLKIKELVDNPDSHKLTLYTRKEDVLNILAKVLQY